MSPTSTTFRQQRFGVRAEFDFRQDDFGYGLRDSTGGRGFPVLYEALDIDARGSFATANGHYLMRWMFLPYLAAIVLWLLGPDAVTFPVIAVVLIASIGVFLASTYELTAVTFTEIATVGTDDQGVRGFIRIIRDAQHDAILDELTSRWRRRVREIAGSVDLTADPAMETLRLGWLRDRGVLSQTEHEWAVAQLRGEGGSASATAH